MFGIWSSFVCVFDGFHLSLIQINLPPHSLKSEYKLILLFLSCSLSLSLSLSLPLSLSRFLMATLSINSQAFLNPTTTGAGQARRVMTTPANFAEGTCFVFGCNVVL